MRFRHELHKLQAGGRLYNFGGDSDSTSNTSSHTENIDQRLLQESGAIGANASGGGTSSVNLSNTTNNTDRSITNVISNTLDGGAIKAAFGLGDHAIDSVTDFATSALSGAHHTAELALDGALASVQDTKDAFYNASKMVATASANTQKGYEDAAKAAAAAYSTSAAASTAAYSSATNQVATAYEGARVGNKNILIVAGMALAAMAVAVYGSRK